MTWPHLIAGGIGILAAYLLTRHPERNDMTRGHTSHGYTGFSYWMTWECGACGARDDIQGEDPTGDVMESIDHTCDADDE
ncbi:hypothetical protein ACWDCO_24265 [Streptomyces albogriseolus]